MEQPKEKPKPKPKKEKRPRGGAMYGDMMGGSGEFRHGHDATAWAPGSEMPCPAMEYGSEMASMGSGYGIGMPGMAGGKRALGQFYISHYLSKGFRPTVGMGATGVAARSYAMVAVKALVPYEKQWEEYERALASATGYSPMHDIPKYLLYVAERAEVSDDPNAPLQWQTISNSSVAIECATQELRRISPGGRRRSLFAAGFDDADSSHPAAALRFAGPAQRSPQEEAGDEYGDGSSRAQANKRKTEGKEEAAAEPKPSGDFSEGLPQMPPAGARHGWLRNDAWAWLPGWVIPAARTWGLAPACTAARCMAAAACTERDDVGYGRFRVDGSYPGAMGGYGMGSGGYGMPGMPGMGMKQPIVKYKMIRFFDFTAEPGKSYQYRVRVMIEDPNRPLDKSCGAESADSRPGGGGSVGES